MGGSGEINDIGEQWSVCAGFSSFFDRFFSNLRCVPVLLFLFFLFIYFAPFFFLRSFLFLLLLSLSLTLPRSSLASHLTLAWPRLFSPLHSFFHSCTPAPALPSSSQHPTLPRTPPLTHSHPHSSNIHNNKAAPLPATLEVGVSLALSPLLFFLTPSTQSISRTTNHSLFATNSENVNQILGFHSTLLHKHQY